MLRGQLGSALNLKIDQIAEGRPNRPGSPLSPKFITIHNTSNPARGADAEAHASFVKNIGYYVHNGKKSWVSWHYTVDDDSIVRHLPLNEVGFHAGSREGNASSIGIEICMNAGIDQPRAFDRAVKLIACLCFDMGLDPASAVKPHMHWSGKACPALLLDKGKIGKTWQDFVDRIVALEASLVTGGESVAAAGAVPVRPRPLFAAPVPAPAPTQALSPDAGRIAALILQGSTVAGLKAARLTAAKNWKPYPSNGCAYHLSALLQQAGIAVKTEGGAGELAAQLEARGWRRVAVGGQRAGDVGVTYDHDPTPPGADHIYLVVATKGPDEMVIADNQRKADLTRARFASGKGKTPTAYFLRA